MACIAFLYPEWAALIAFVALIPLVFIAIKLGAGRSEEKIVKVSD